MDSRIKALWELQQVDLEILNIEKRINEIPNKKSALEEKLKALEDEKKMREDSRDKLIEEKNRREKEVEQENEKIKMVEARLPYIRNQKDYLEVRRKIDLAKKSNKLREDEILKKMEEIEKLNAELEEFMKNYREEEAKIKEGLALFDNELNALEIQKQEFLEKRELVASKLDASILKTYELLRKNCRGIGVSRARNESCEGCFMNLPPQLYNMIMKGDKLYHCPFCQRFLVYIPEEKDDNKQ